MQGQNVVTSDDHKLGTVVAERDGFVIVESGHMFKSRHAIPTDFLHEHDDVVRATVGKDVVHDSPKIDGDTFDEYAVKMHYGLIEVNVVDPDPNESAAGDPTTEAPTGLDPADTASFGGHVRTHIGENDRSAKPAEP
jgi:hypothetical protein